MLISRGEICLPLLAADHVDPQQVENDDLGEVPGQLDEVFIKGRLSELRAPRQFDFVRANIEPKILFYTLMIGVGYKRSKFKICFNLGVKHA